MKQRVTYVVHSPDDFDPSQLRLSPTNDAFTLDSVNAAKEHRLTFGLSELPQEVRFEYQHITFKITSLRYIAISGFEAMP